MKINQVGCLLFIKGVIKEKKVSIDINCRFKDIVLI